MMADVGLFKIPVEEIWFRGGFDPDVAPLVSNTGKPVIVIERPDFYQLIDGWGRISGLRNAGAEYAQAILVSNDDLSERTRTGDDEEWNEAMWCKYAPQYTYCGTTN